MVMYARGYVCRCMYVCMYVYLGLYGNVWKAMDIHWYILFGMMYASKLMNVCLIARVNE